MAISQLSKVAQAVRVEWYTENIWQPPDDDLVLSVRIRCFTNNTQRIKFDTRNLTHLSQSTVTDLVNIFSLIWISPLLPVQLYRLHDVTSIWGYTDFLTNKPIKKWNLIGQLATGYFPNSEIFYKQSKGIFSSSVNNFICVYSSCLLLYLLVSTRAVIGQFSGPYSPLRPAKI